MILLLSNSEDPHLDPVAAELRRRGVDHRRLDTDRIWPDVRVDVHLDVGTGNEGSLAGHRWHGTLCIDGDRVELRAVTAIWTRRPSRPGVDPRIEDPAARRFAEAEWGAALHGVLRGSDAKWMSDPDRIRAASFKPAQLRYAALHGFDLPRTRITHDPVSARAFLNDMGGRAIAKVVGPGAPTTPGIEPYNVFAHVITVADLDAPQISACPLILQEVIPKRTELRVTVVGDRVLACELDSQAVPEARDDWRRADTDDVPHRPVDLPAGLAELCRGFTASLGLNFAAIDLIRTPDDRYIFLELNPNGQWLWIEDLAGVAISRSIAEWLADTERATSARSTSFSSTRLRSTIPHTADFPEAP